ncbi:hypothetical protein OG604_16365 [Streptomyces sp. NBC_01231]|nr:hypothetical protein OG604_16365 [Streptomyces sp. NBC_01231]
MSDGVGAQLPRVSLDDPDVDLDYGLRLLYRGEPFTGEVEEYLAGHRVSLVTYEDGFRDGPYREWYKDGTLSAEGVMRMGFVSGEFKRWHPNGVLAKHMINSEDGRTPLEALRPVGFPEAEFSGFLIAGPGMWLDEHGSQHLESRLVELTVSSEPVGLSADVSVHHDIWGPFDFHGAPHPEVHRQNAPRLAAALIELEELLGVAAEPGESTYFGRAVGFGVMEPEAVDGRGPDLTDQL